MESSSSPHTTAAPQTVVRPPLQERSRRLWNRTLDTALDLLIEGGLEAVTVSEVCRRARISPPSLYARVDGLAGLISATYEYGMDSVRATEADALARVPDEQASVRDRIASVIDAVDDVFIKHRAVLQPIIASSARDTQIRDRGIYEARRVQLAMARALRLPDDVAADIAATVFAAIVVRTSYGLEFTSAHDTEDVVAFRDRLTRMGVARALAG